MELKHLVQRCVYRIEPKAEGGFIARASDPAVPPLEAATREELQQLIQAKLMAALGEAFPGFTLPAAGKQVSVSVHVERKPGGGFAVHSDDPGAPGFNPAAQEKFDHYAEELLGFVDKHFPHLSEHIAEQVTGHELKVFTTTSSTATTQSRPLSKMFLPTQPSGASDQATAPLTIDGAGMNPALLSNAPITPETSKSGAIVRLLVIVLIVAAVLYFFYRR
jgi:hypothetical protein